MVRVRSSGEEVNLPETQVCKLRDGKIAEVPACRTKAEAVRAIGLEA